jgi:hypothetical protein
VPRDTRIDGELLSLLLMTEPNSRYVFDEVLNQEATQSMVFERTAKPILAGVLDGYNATVFAYGVSPG